MHRNTIINFPQLSLSLSFLLSLSHSHFLSLSLSLSCSCGKLSIDKCNHGERINRSKPYPECCLLRYKCKKPDGKPYFIERDAAEGA